MATTRELAAERLRVPEAAQRLGVSTSSVYRYVRQGRLRATRDRQGLLFTGLDVWIMSGWRGWGRQGPPLYSDEEWARLLEADKVELPPELRHLLSA